MSLGRLVSWGIVAFWVVMMTLLVRLEVLPALRVGAPASYRSVLAHLKEPKTVRMGIYAFGRRLGTTTSTTRPLPDGSVHIGNETDIELGILTAERAELTPLTTLGARSDLWVSADYRLQRFHMTVTSALLSVRMWGVAEGEELLFTLEVGGESHTARIPFDPEMPLADSLAPVVTARNLRLGRQWEVNVLSPRDLTLTQALVRVVGEGRAVWRGQQVRTYRLLVSYEGNELEVEVTAEGEVLRQTINWPLRLTFVREEAEGSSAGVRP